MKIELLYNTPLWVCSKAIRRCWASEDKSDTITVDGQHDYDCIDDTTKIMTETLPKIICGDKDKELIERVGNKNKHKSTLEHLVYTFDIDGISRACLQELARHRMASYSVKSTRYTLKELKDEKDFVISNDDEGLCNLTNEEYESYRESSVENYNMLYAYERAKKYLVFSSNEQIINNSIMSLELLREALQDGVSNDIAKYCLPEAYKTSLIMTINARSLQNFLELRSNKYALWEIRELALNIYEAIPEEHKYLFGESINND